MDLHKRLRNRAAALLGVKDLQVHLTRVTEILSDLDRRAIETIPLRILAEEYLRERVLTLGRLLSPQKAVDVKKARFGCPSDGGYVMLNDLAGARGALSFGIEGNATWDEDMARLGIRVYQFDHTVDAPAENPMFQFRRVKIVPVAGPEGESIASIAASTGATEQGSLILKMDIEGDEWPVFDATPPEVLRLFSQIACEFHGFGEIADTAKYDRMKRVLEKLSKQFAPVHVHANNHAAMLLLAGVPFPDVLEVTFANRERYRFEPSDEMFPTPLDSANRPVLPDYFLGRFQF